MPRSSQMDDLLDMTETLLRAQLAAVEELREKREKRKAALARKVSEPKNTSQTDMAVAILTEAGQPLHILEIVRRIRTRFGREVSRDSLVSAILKKVAKHQLFVKTDKNTYGLLGRDGRP